MLLRLVPTETKIDFYGRRLIAFAFSCLLLVATGVGLATKGLNFGIDFKGGILVEVRMPEAVNIADMRSQLSGLELGDVSLQEFGQPTDILIGIQQQEGDEAEQLAAVEVLKNALGGTAEYRRVEFVGPKVGAELIEAGAIAVGLALLAILVYVWFRFEWHFGFAAVVALAHDVILTIGVFSWTGLEFNLATVAAVLTIAGYSINDTVVVFDRVRENLRKYKKMTMPDLLNLSLNDTLSRTVMTSATTLLALFALFFFGGEVIRGFSFALIWGVLIGTYSSIFIACSLLPALGLKREKLVFDDDKAEDDKVDVEEKADSGAGA